MNKLYLIGILTLLILVIAPNVLAVPQVVGHGIVFTPQGSASEGEGIGIKVFSNFTIISVNKQNSTDTSTRFYLQNAARNSNLSNASFSGDTATINYAITNSNGTSGTQYYLVTNANGSSRQTNGLNPGVSYPILGLAGFFNWSNSIINDAVGTVSAFGIYNITIDNNIALSPIFLIAPTPSNNTVNYVTNNTLSIRTNASSIPGNTTIRVYNSTGGNVSSAFNNSNYTSLNLTGLALGVYYYNATFTNGTLINSTETRIFTVYNLTSGSITNPINNSNISRTLNVNWTTANTTNNATAISNYTIFLMNANLSLNTTLGVVANNSFFGYDTYTAGLVVGSYYVIVGASDAQNNKVNSTPVLFNKITDSLFNITLFNASSGVAITTFSVNLTDLNTSVMTQYSVTNGSMFLDTVIGHSYSIFIDSSAFAYNLTSYVQNQTFTNLAFGLLTTNSVNLSIYDALTLLPITQPMLVTVTLVSAINYTTSTGNIFLTGLGVGLNEIKVSNANYSESRIYINITNRSTQSASIYLLSNASVQNLQINWFDENGAPIIGMYTSQSITTSNGTILQQSIYTDIAGASYFTYNQNYYYTYNCTSTIYVCIPFILNPPRQSEYDVTLDFITDSPSYSPLNVSGAVTYDNSSNNISLSYISMETGYVYYAYFYIFTQGNWTLISSDSSTLTTDTFIFNANGYNGTILVQGFANETLFLSEYVLVNTQTLGQNMSIAEQAFWVGIIDLIFILFFIRWGPIPTLVGGVIGTAVNLLFGFSAVLTYSILSIHVVVAIVIAIALKRR